MSTYGTIILMGAIIVWFGFVIAVGDSNSSSIKTFQPVCKKIVVSSKIPIDKQCHSWKYN